MKETGYRYIYAILKSGIQRGAHKVDAYLPSEKELCTTYKITGTTVRKALDELLREGFIEKERGKGSRIIERRKSLGLLNIKGFSKAVGENVSTIFLQKPQFQQCPKNLKFSFSDKELDSKSIYFERLGCVGELPVMLESNWFSSNSLDGFLDCELRRVVF